MDVYLMFPMFRILNGFLIGYVTVKENLLLFFFFFDSENSTTISLIRTKVLINYIQSKLVCYYRGGVFHPNLRCNTTASCPSHNVCSIVTLSAYMAQRPKLKGTKSHSYTFHHLHN